MERFSSISSEEIRKLVQKPVPESTKRSMCFASCFVLSCFRAAAFAVSQNIWRIIKTINYFWLLKYAQIVVLGHYLFLEAHSCPWASLSATVHFSEQIIPSDNYPCIFPCPKYFIVYISFPPVWEWNLQQTKGTCEWHPCLWLVKLLRPQRKYSWAHPMWCLCPMTGWVISSLTEWSNGHLLRDFLSSCSTNHPVDNLGSRCKYFILSPINVPCLVISCHMLLSMMSTVKPRYLKLSRVSSSSSR